MNQCYLYSSPSGIELIEGDKMPGKPDFRGDFFLHYGPQKEYEAALQYAKASGIPVKDQERAKDMIASLRIERGSEATVWASYQNQEGAIYGPFTVEYEIKTVLSPGWTPSYNDPDNIGGHPNAEPMEVAVLHDGKQGISVDQLAEAKARIQYLEGIINSPEINNFIEGIKLESTHQTERWGLQEEYLPGHFVMVANKLLGKMCVDIWDGKADKFKHHCIALASVMFNIHRQVDKKGTAANYCFYPQVDDTPEKDDDTLFAEACKNHIRNAPSKTYRVVPEKETHSIRCASHTSEALEKRGHIPGKCDCMQGYKEPQEDLKEKIEFIKGAFQCYVGFPSTEGLLKFLNESKFTITRKQ